MDSGMNEHLDAFVWIYMGRCIDLDDLHGMALRDSGVQMTSHRKGVWKSTSISAERSLHVAREVFFVISFVDELIELCEWCEWTRHSA